MAFDAIKNSLSDDSGRLTFAQSMFAGMMAGATESVVAVTPTERLKTAMYDQPLDSSRFHFAPCTSL
jgi:solute carrier family 25 citrate transporter 1